MFVFFPLYCTLTISSPLIHLSPQNITDHHIAFFQFPRVVLMLDEDSLELTRECEQDLKKVVDADTVKWFKAKYGRR